MTNPSVLTATDIDAIPAGRKLDALIAEWVFGYKVDYEFDDPIVPELRDKYDPFGILPNYSTDISDAWIVVEILRERKIDTSINTSRVGYQAIISARHSGFFEGPPPCESAPLAICRGALKAILTP